MSDYALPWIKRTYPAVMDSTYEKLAIHLQHLIDEIGNKRISEIKPSDIKSVYANRYNGLSNTYIRSGKQLFCALFDSAQADGLIPFNPAREKSARPHKGNKPKERILSKRERYWIETLCTDHRAFPAVMTMLYAGLRPQECKAVIIERDIDFERNIITVRETAHVDGQKYAYTTDGKTEYSNRQVPLFPPLKRVLSGRRGYLISSAHGERVTIQTWKTAYKSYVYCMETAINGISRRWYGKTKEQRRLAEEGKLPEWIPFDVVPYTLRHGYCQFLRDSGVELNTARRWMGHKDAKMILKVYDSVSDDRSETERKKVENRLIRVQNEVQNDFSEAGTVEE
ncbi:MAG: tyrosine-type recombinase/integrase [Kiritimatiellae bacterium]|nr:tyrosine-type recombinase/integrase [Kiritimatiellia bacterium]